METCLKTARRLVAVSALLLPLVSTGCRQAAESPPPQPPQVEVAEPTVRDVTVVHEFTGTAEAFKSVEIRARVQGFLEKITYEPASLVRRGQQLFVIEQAPFIAARDRAAASLASAEAGLRRAESDLDRLEQAVRTNAVSQQEVTRASAERDQAEAALLGARAALQSAEIDLGYTVIESPISGLATRNLVDAGNLVGASGSTLLATVRQVNPIFAYFDVSERYVARVLAERDGYDQPGEAEPIPATLVLKETGLKVEGRIDSIDNTVDPATGTIQLRGVFPNDKALVFPGFFVHVQLPGETLPNALLVEETSLGTDLGGRYLMVVGTDNVVEKRYVEPGPLQEGARVVLEGLAAGERYITAGLQRARPGLPVTPSGSGGSS